MSTLFSSQVKSQKTFSKTIFTFSITRI